jgi:hypothetical protein
MVWEFLFSRGTGWRLGLIHNPITYKLAIELARANHELHKRGPTE